MSGPIGAVTSGYRRALTFSGRATRSEFWWFVLFFVITTQVLYQVVGAVAPQVLVATVQLLALTLPLSACLTRRMRDAGRSTLWAVPAIGFLFAGPLMAMLGLEAALFEFAQTVETTGGIENAVLALFSLAFGVLFLLAIPAFIFCFLASAPEPPADEAGDE